MILNVGYSQGPEFAKRLEANNIICNYQASPDEESFTASGALRMGVSEMTRFGMEAEDFGKLSQLMKDIIVNDAKAVDDVKALREQFQEMQFCFKTADFGDYVQRLHQLI